MKITALVQKLQQFGWKCPGVTCISFLYYLSYKNCPLALLEPQIPYPLDVAGKNNDVFFGVDGGCCCLSFMYGCGGSDGG